MANDLELPDESGAVYLGEVDAPKASKAANYLKGHTDAVKGMNPVKSVTKGYEAARDFLKGDSPAKKVVLGLSDPGDVYGIGQRVLSPSAPEGTSGPAPDGVTANPYDRTFGTMSMGAPGGGMQLTPPRLIGAHFDQSRIPLRPGTQDMLRGALDNSGTIAAHQNLANVQANAADASANILEREAERAQYERSQRMERENERQGFVREQLDKARKLNEEASKMSVDPGRFFRSPGGVLMAIGAVLRPGNEGMALLERSWDADKSDQREAINVARQRGASAENTLAKYQDTFRDERAAELAWEADARDISRMKLMAIAERSQSPQIMAQANLVGTNLSEQAKAKRAELEARFDQQSYVPATVVGGMGASSKPLENIVNLPNGVSLQMPTKESQNKAIEKIEYTEVIRRNNAEALRLRALARDPKNLAQIPQINQQLKALQDQTVSVMSLARGQGTVKEPEFARAADGVAAYTSLSPGSDKTINASSEYAVQDLGFFMRASGAEQVQRGYRQTATGLQPSGAYVGHNVTPQAVQDPKSFQLQMPTGIKSDIFAKNVISGPATGSFDKLTSGGGLDVMGSLEAHSNFATQYNSDPSGGMMGGGLPIISDERAKEAAYWAGHESGIRTAESEQRDIAEHGGPGSKYAQDIAAAKAYVAANQRDAQAGVPKRPRLTPQEEAAAANLGGTPLAQAARSQQGAAWSYKPEFRPPNQAPGEVQFGPVLERGRGMAADPVASTAVKQGPDGLMELDPAKTLTLNAAINADQQQQLDKIAMALAHFKGKPVR